MWFKQWNNTEKKPLLTYLIRRTTTTTSYPPMKVQHFHPGPRRLSQSSSHFCYRRHFPGTLRTGHWWYGMAYLGRGHCDFEPSNATYRPRPSIRGTHHLPDENPHPPRRQREQPTLKVQPMKCSLVLTGHSRNDPWRRRWMWRGRRLRTWNKTRIFRNNHYH